VKAKPTYMRKKGQKEVNLCSESERKSQHNVGGTKHSRQRTVSAHPEKGKILAPQGLQVVRYHNNLQDKGAVGEET
jgi:hypothetical protein